MHLYSLKGNKTFPQVSPDASYWLKCPTLLAPQLDEVIEAVGDVTPFTDFDEQQELQDLRPFIQTKDDELDQNTLSIFLKDRMYAFPPPAGAVLSRRATGPLLATGAELARLFENKTPGLWHRQVLNVLLDANNPASEAGRRLSPPRQAVVWAALDIAIYSALSSAWHYKWLFRQQEQRQQQNGPNVAYRRRPWEADQTLDVLFDFTVIRDVNGIIQRGPLREGLSETPGTPRHPAYPSGHSTYSAAASTVLGCFFPELCEEFRKLAENIGTARFYGGVHWLTDHVLGRRVGNAVGNLIIEQLNQSGSIMRCPQSFTDVPPIEVIQKMADSVECGAGKENFCDGIDCEEQGFQNLVGFSGSN